LASISTVRIDARHFVDDLGDELEGMRAETHPGPSATFALSRFCADFLDIAQAVCERPDLVLADAKKPSLASFQPARSAASGAI